MQFGPLSIAWGKAPPLEQKQTFLPLSPGGGGWWPVVRETFTGAWQQNAPEVTAADAMAYSAVYACISTIAADIAKLPLRLVQQGASGIWTETTSPAFSPVLRAPNGYQTMQAFIEQWLVTKLSRGNTYAVKRRDGRGVVTALYHLDPARVTPLVTPDGAVYYDVKRDDLSQQKAETVTIPASEMIHDRMCPIWHPLIGVTPIYACGTAALQGLSIQNTSQKFFKNGSQPSGFLTALAAISDETAARLKTYFEANFSGDNVGRIAIGGDGLKYEPFTMTAVDAQLIEQLRWTVETVCSCFHMTPWMVGVGPLPPYGNIAPAIQQYYAQCLQNLITAVENLLDAGLGLTMPIDGTQYGTEFDLDDLILMDTATRTKAAAEALGSGAMSPNEGRYRYFNLEPVKGGDTPYMQQQYWPLSQLAERAIPGMPAAPGAPQPVPEALAEAAEDDEDDDETDAMDRAALLSLIHRKAIGEGLYA